MHIGKIQGGGYIEWTKLYRTDDALCLKAKDMLLAMLSPIIPKEELFPLLPFYGGIIVNVEYMNEHTTSSGRGIFDGTLHQYIGCLWNELLRNENLCAVITETPLVALGYDVEEKTYIDEVTRTGIDPASFYNKLCLKDEIKKEIIEYSRQIIRCFF